MSFGFQLLAWRRHRGFTQLQLSQKAGVPRPYLCRLELDQGDPSLSMIRKLAAALDVGIGELVEELPIHKALTNEQLDQTARQALRPSTPASGEIYAYARPLSRILKERRAALGLYKPRRTPSKKTRGVGGHALRRLKADLGEAQWQALLKRIDKHAIYLAPEENENS